MIVNNGNAISNYEVGWFKSPTNGTEETSTSTGNSRLFSASLIYNDIWNDFVHVLRIHSDLENMDDRNRLEAERRFQSMSAALSGNRLGLTGADAKIRNFILLTEILESQTKEDDDYVSDKVVDNVLKIVFHVVKQPEIYRTFDNSLNLQYELPDRSYLEFEVFEDRVTCMLVPQRVYEKAVFPEVALDRLDIINEIVGDFYGLAKCTYEEQ